MNFFSVRFILFVVLILIVNLTSPWFIRVASEDYFVGVVLLLITSVIFFALIDWVSQKVGLIAFVVLIVLAIVFSYNNFERGLMNPSALEIHNTTTRQGYYFNRFGPWIHNKYTLGVYKYQRNFFTNLGFNQYFFGGEPRFRPFALDFAKYPLIDLLFFIIGLLFLLKLKKQKIFVFLGFSVVVLLIVSIANPSYMLGLYPLYPLVTSVIMLGVYKLVISANYLRKRYV